MENERKMTSRYIGGKDGHKEMYYIRTLLVTKDIREAIQTAGLKMDTNLTSIHGFKQTKENLVRNLFG
ncbi:MAG: hypothetical protein QXU18_09965 [Thermoplasmatales archaeon]